MKKHEKWGIFEGDFCTLIHEKFKKKYIFAKPFYCFINSNYNINSNYRHLLSSDEKTLMMVKIWKGEVSCHSHANTSKPMSPKLRIFLFDHKNRMLQRALQRFTSKLFFKAEHQFQLSIFSSNDQTLTMLKIRKGQVSCHVISTCGIKTKSSGTEKTRGSYISD